MDKVETRGRKTKCTKEVIEELCDVLENQTLTMEDSCLLCGITFQTYRNWYLRGEEEENRIIFDNDESPLESEEIYLEFYRAIQKAIPQRKKNLLSEIKSAASGGREYTETRKIIRDGEIVEEVITKKVTMPQWQAAAWMLERAHPDEFSKTIKHDWRKKIKEGGEDPEQVLQDLTRAFLEAGDNDKLPS